MIAALVLAAGSSQRMGARNKLLLPVGDHVLIRHVVARVHASNVGKTLVVLGHEHHAVKMALAGLEIEMVHNLRHAEGMATTIQAGVRAVPPEAHGLMMVLADMPLLETSDYNRLIDAFENAPASHPAPIVVPTFENTPGNPVIFASAYREVLLQLEGPRGGKAQIRQNPEAVIRVPMPNDHILHDMDTDDAYQRLLRRLG